MKLICNNKKASFDYFLLDTYEAGIKLTGTEIKSIRAGKVNINDAYVVVRNGKVFILNMFIGTSTDPNMTTEATPENVNKAINSFKKNIERLKTENVSDEELNMAKTVLKSNLLNALEGNQSKSGILQLNMASHYDVDFATRKLEIIDKITAIDSTMNNIRLMTQKI